MKQEFITTRGKLIIENNSLFIRNYKIDFRETVAGQLWFPFLLIAAGILICIYADKPLDYFIGTFWILSFLLFHSKKVYDVLIKKSFSGRIQLSRIHSFEIRPDEPGLETEVLLHLRNGRNRSILFRTMEKQYEAFTDALSSFVHSTVIV